MFGGPNQGQGSGDGRAQNLVDSGPFSRRRRKVGQKDARIEEAPHHDRSSRPALIVRLAAESLGDGAVDFFAESLADRLRFLVGEPLVRRGHGGVEALQFGEGSAASLCAPEATQIREVGGRNERRARFAIDGDEHGLAVVPKIRR